MKKLHKKVLRIATFLVLGVLLNFSNSWAENKAAAGSLTWTLDTLGSITTRAVVVDLIQWIGCTNNAHTFLLEDASGNTIWEDVCEVGRTKLYPIYGDWIGLTVDTLGSGKLLIKRGSM
jgi:hypothetical protein